MTGGNWEPSFRIRNLPGTPEFCPLVFRTPALEEFVALELGDRAKSLSPDHAFVLVSREGEKVPFLALVGGLAREKGLGAGELAKRLAGILGGGGGGRPDRAQGQGLSAAAVPQALEAARAAIDGALGPA